MPQKNSSSASRVSRLPPNSSEINCCYNPNCDNFLVPVDESKPAKESPVTITGANNQDKSIKCRKCGSFRSIKSKTAVDEEINRIKNEPYIKIRGSHCPNESCTNNAVSTSVSGHYQKDGYDKNGNSRYKCKSCGKRFTVNLNPIKRQQQSNKNIALFKLLISQVSIRRMMFILELSAQTIYDKIDYIYKQCLLFARYRESQIPDTYKENKYVNLCTDIQDYTVNWVSKDVKRNVMIKGIGTACLESSYVLLMSLNYDANVDYLELVQDARSVNDEEKTPAWRKYARYWLPGEFKKSVDRYKSLKKSKENINLTSLPSDVLDKYLEEKNRKDPDCIDEPDDGLQLPPHGGQTHAEYTAFAHFSVLNEITSGAKYVNHFMDQDQLFRSAFFYAHRNDLRDKTSKRVTGVFVTISKGLSVDARNSIFNAAKKSFENYCKQNPNLSQYEAKTKRLLEELTKPTAIDLPDNWYANPLPSMSEPIQVFSILNNLGQKTTEEFAKTCVNATLHPIDRFFMQVRRMLSYCERPIHTQSNINNVWTGKQPYNPAHLVKFIEIFRVYYNFCKPGDDKKTPAMRLGIAKGVVDISDILYFEPKIK